MAREGAVAKISGKEGEVFQGSARVFESEEEALQKILDGTVQKGDVIVIRYEGPKGSPGMREMLSPTGAIMRPQERIIFSATGRTLMFF